MELLVSLRWQDGVECPRCGSRKVIRIKHRPWNWVCKSGAQVMDRRTGQDRRMLEENRLSLLSARRDRVREHKLQTPALV